MVINRFIFLLTGLLNLYIDEKASHSVAIPQVNSVRSITPTLPIGRQVHNNTIVILSVAKNLLVHTPVYVQGDFSLFHNNYKPLNYIIFLKNKKIYAVLEKVLYLNPANFL